MNSDSINISIKDRLRLSSIKRWHMLDTTRVQTVADHSYGVAIVAREIWAVISDAIGYGESCTLVMVLCAALDHDADEAYTGDCHNPGRLSVEEFAARFKQHWVSCDLTKRIVKLADLIEARHTVTQIGIGEYANAIKWSYNRCIDWAMSHFADGLGLQPEAEEALVASLTKAIYDEFDRDCLYSLKF